MRLLLAKSHARQTMHDRSQMHLAAAIQQYKVVLHSDPGNKEAIRGMMILYADTATLDQAYAWAQKAIEADNTDASGYYTAAVIDWKMAFPDYMKARQQAGMQPQDPGIIPDANLRQSVRDQHLAQIEDGLRLLQTALQLKPDYSDAMAYMNLLYRLEAGIANTAAEGANLVVTADDWVGKALAAKKKQAQYGTPNSMSEPWVLAPPPPPPPPPPPAGPAANPREGR